MERLPHEILKRAFEGKRVPQDPTDEPACVLLQRINTLRDGKINDGQPARTRRGRRVSKPANLEE